MRYLTFLAIGCISLSACGQKQDIGETITVENGVKIPIKACVDGNKKILGNSVDPVSLCKCLLPKLYTDLKNDPEKIKALKEGNWYDLSKNKQELIAKYFQDCISQSGIIDSSTKLTITPRMAEGIKNKMKNDLIGSDIEKNNDVDKFCDCMILSLKTDFSAKEIMQPNFNETEKYKKALDKCLETTKKK